MLTINPKRSILLVIDIQSRLMPVIHEAGTITRNANRLIDAAKLCGIPRLFTEQNPKGLGPTAAEIPVERDSLVRKQYFNACREEGFLDRIPKDAAVVVIGCEAHVCVLQTVLGLLDASRNSYVVRDAVGSRTVDNKEASFQRMAGHGAELVTTEMVVFEWLQTAENPAFRAALTLIK